MPTERCALYTRRVFAHAGERGQLAQILRGRRILAREKRTHALEYLIDRRAALALDGLGHERRGGRGDGAALALEMHVFNSIAVQAHENRQAVAAERVMSFRLRIARIQTAEVSRPAVVIEDHVAIQILQVHQANTSRTRSTAHASRATSSAVL